MKLFTGEDAGTSEAAVGALTVVRNMTARSHACRDAVREAGAFLPLVVLLGSGLEKDVTCLAAAAIRNLARNHEVNRTALREAGGALLLPVCALWRWMGVYPCCLQLATPERRKQLMLFFTRAHLQLSPRSSGCSRPARSAR